jgi:hypothetical protein
MHSTLRFASAVLRHRSSRWGLALLISVAGIGAATAQPAAQVTVRFAEGGQIVEGGIDAGARAAAVKSLTSALQMRLDELAPQCLASGQVLEVILTEVDATGFAAERRADSRGEIRIVRNAWVASLSFEYALRGPDKNLLESGNERLRASGFVGDDPVAKRSTEAYPTEKALIGDWFRARYCRVGATPTDRADPK